jgi:beta-phosphoglucomutase-like phosphatase (HAD superfamily)
MFIYVNNVLFIAGWIISAVLFFLQWRLLLKTKEFHAVSVTASIGFFMLNLNSSTWLYLHHEWFSIIGSMGISLSNLGIAITGKLLKYRSQTKAVFPYEGVLWDLDGMLVDTQTPVHAAAEVAVLAEYGVIVDPEFISKEYAGRSTIEVFKILAPHLDPVMLYEKKWALIRKQLDEGSVDPIPKMFETVKLLAEKKIPQCIASASPRWYIYTIMKKTFGSDSDGVHTMKEYFGLYYVSAEEVNRPKPAPDVFQKAAEVIGCNPKKCLVLGDGYSDVVGGLSAGASVIYFGKSQDRVNQHRNVLTFKHSEDIYRYIKTLLK